MVNFKDFKKLIEDWRQDKNLCLASELGPDTPDVRTCAESLGKALQDSSITTLNLSDTNLNARALAQLAPYLKHTSITTLDLSGNKFGDDGLAHVSACLKDTEITSLNLKSCEITCAGVTQLAQILRHTHVSHLVLANNLIRGAGVTCLIHALKYTSINTLDLRKNIIFRTAAEECLREILAHTQCESVYMQVYYAENGETRKYITQNVHCKYIDVSLDNHAPTNNNKIGTNGADYINRTFRHVGVTKLTLDSCHALEKYDAINLAAAFKDINISELNVSIQHVRQPNGVAYLTQAFRQSKIGKVQIHNGKIGGIRPTADAIAGDLFVSNAEMLSDFLREISVISVHLCEQDLVDDDIKHLADALKANGDVMYVNLAHNQITHVGAKYLAEMLASPNSKIVDLNLSFNRVSVTGAEHLAKAVARSEVTRIDLEGNALNHKGEQYFGEFFDSKYIAWLYHLKPGADLVEEDDDSSSSDEDSVVIINAHASNSLVTVPVPIVASVSGPPEAEPPRSSMRPRDHILRVIDPPVPEKIKVFTEQAGLPKITKKVHDAHKLCQNFRQLVHCDAKSGTFAFYISPYIQPGCDYFRHHAEFIDALHNRANACVHIFDMVCNNSYYLNLNLMRECATFCRDILHRFTAFFNAELLEFVQAFGACSLPDAIVVREFERYNLSTIVANLLMHRPLFYVDEREEILHPFIYLLLHKYDMPVFDARLEPNKKAQIVAYYSSHQDLDGVSELMDFLEGDAC